MVDVARDGVDVLVGLDAEHLGAARIDRQDFAWEAVLLQEALRPGGGALLVGGGADQRDSFGLEQESNRLMAGVYSPHVVPS